MYALTACVLIASFRPVLEEITKGVDMPLFVPIVMWGLQIAQSVLRPVAVHKMHDITSMARVHEPPLIFQSREYPGGWPILSQPRITDSVLEALPPSCPVPIKEFFPLEPIP